MLAKISFMIKVCVNGMTNMDRNNAKKNEIPTNNSPKKNVPVNSTNIDLNNDNLSLYNFNQNINNQNINNQNINNQNNNIPEINKSKNVSLNNDALNVNDINGIHPPPILGELQRRGIGREEELNLTFDPGDVSTNLLNRVPLPNLRIRDYQGNNISQPRRAIDNLKDDNPLVEIFLNKIDNVSDRYSMPGKLNKMINEIVEVRGFFSEHSLYMTDWKLSMIYESFITLIPIFKFGVAAALEWKKMSPIITNEIVISSAFDLLNSYLLDRFHDLDGIHFTIDKWTEEELVHIEQFRTGCTDRINRINIAKKDILQEIKNRGLGYLEFNNESTGSVIKEIIRRHAGRIFPDEEASARNIADYFIRRE